MAMDSHTREQLERHLSYLKMSGVKYFPKAGLKAAEREPQGLRTTEAQGTAATSMAPAAESLDGIRADLGDCLRCSLSGTRKHLLFGEGDPQASLLFVCSSPDREEDEKGRFFEGEAGQLLAKIIGAIELRPQEVYISGLVKCRPSDGKTLEKAHIDTCNTFLQRQIKAIKPRVICALGDLAAQALLGTREPVTSLRGRFHDLNGIHIMPTFEPASLIEDPSRKRDVWEDMKLVMKLLKERE